MQLHSIPLAEAAYFYTQHKNVYIVTTSGKKLPIDQKLDHLEEILDPLKFFRINRQFIISIDAIDKMYAYSKSRVKLTLKPPSDQDIIVSTIRSPEFKKWLSGKP
jgi:DNA-binding LytR/AlgR family response regulator